jgi:hypothetical protein
MAETNRKQEWESPTLTVLGDLEALTMAAIGTGDDNDLFAS